jgi:hypothetical protein
MKNQMLAALLIASFSGSILASEAGIKIHQARLDEVKAEAAQFAANHDQDNTRLWQMRQKIVMLQNVIYSMQDIKAPAVKVIGKLTMPDVK